MFIWSLNNQINGVLIPDSVQTICFLLANIWNAISPNVVLYRCEMQRWQLWRSHLKHVCLEGSVLDEPMKAVQSWPVDLSPHFLLAQIQDFDPGATPLQTNICEGWVWIRTDAWAFWRNALIVYSGKFSRNPRSYTGQPFLIYPIHFPVKHWYCMHISANLLSELLTLPFLSSVLPSCWLNFSSALQDNFILLFSYSSYFFKEELCCPALFVPVVITKTALL